MNCSLSGGMNWSNFLIFCMDPKYAHIITFTSGCSDHLAGMLTFTEFGFPASFIGVLVHSNHTSGT
jgi:hypothetical protein